MGIEDWHCMPLPTDLGMGDPIHPPFLCPLQDQLLFCDDCDRGYHMYCLKPPIKEPPEGVCIILYRLEGRK